MDNPFYKPLDKTKIGFQKAEEPVTEIAVDPATMVGEALTIVRGNREQVYGSPDQNFLSIAGLWNIWLTVRLNHAIQLDGADVCFLMQLMKLARLANSPTHRDSIVDIIGYADCVDIVRSRQNALNS